MTDVGASATLPLTDADAPALTAPVAGMMHADLDCFFAAVEQRDQPSLLGRPVIVGGGVVLTASYEARHRGVRTAMGIAEARRRCPEAVIVEPRPARYSEASAAVFEIFRDTTPLVEPMSVDEAFLDVRGLWRIDGSPLDIALRLRQRVADEVGLPITVGVARTKFLAKIASAVAKPSGVLVIEPDEEDDFLHPLDIRRLWGVGPATEERLRAKGIHTVGDLAALPPAVLVHLVGAASGRHLHALANNHDPRRVETGRRRRSIGAQNAIGSGPHTRGELDRTLARLVDRVCERLRDGRRVGRCVTVRFRLGDFARQTRSRTLVEATDRTDLFLEAARALLHDHWDELRHRGCTLIGVAIGELCDADAVQLSLDLDGHDRGSLDRTLDAVRTRFESGVVGRALHVGRSTAPSVPILADPTDGQRTTGPAVGSASRPGRSS